LAIVYADSGSNYGDKALYHNSGTDVSDCRNATTGTSWDTGDWFYFGHAEVDLAPPYGKIAIYRPVLSFDVSGESGTVSSVNLKLTSKDNISFITYSEWNGKTHVCKVEDIGSSWNNDDYNALDGWVSSGDYTGEVTEYATAFDNAESTTHTVAFNEEAISDLNSLIGTSDRFHIMLLHSDDFEYNTGSPGGLGDPSADGGILNLDGGHFWSSDHTTNAERPQLDITYGVPGYSHDVMGMDSGDISTVSGIATADISEVIGM
jgi:hypothetical protein